MTFTTAGLETLTRSMVDLPIWVGLVTAKGEPADGYARARVSAWRIDGNRARTEVAFVAGHDWGRVVGFLLADAPTGQALWAVPIDVTVAPRAGDTLTVEPWVELHG